MTIKTMPFDAADYLSTAEARAVFLTEALKSDDPALIASAIGAVARACGMATIAKSTGLPRKVLNDVMSARGDPHLATVLKVLQAAGLRLAVRSPKKSASRMQQRATATSRKVA
jgi:probable addiction module antidote protein